MNKRERIWYAVIEAQNKIGGTLEDVADRLSVTRSLLYQWRNGTIKNPQADAMLKLAELSELSVQWIVSGRGPRRNRTSIAVPQSER